MDIYEKENGENDSSVALACNSLGILYHLMGEYNQAEIQFLRSLKIYEKAMDVQTPMIAAATNNLASVYWDQERLLEAEKLIVRALSMAEKKLHAKHPDLIRYKTSLKDIRREMREATI